MPIFQVVRCFDDKCSMFQVQQVKKENKWKCVVCGAKQSLKRVYFEAQNAKDCRQVTQDFNMKRGEMAEMAKEKEEAWREERRRGWGEEEDEDYAGGRSATEAPPQAVSKKWDLFVESTSEMMDGNGNEEGDDPRYTTVLAETVRAGKGKGAARKRKAADDDDQDSSPKPRWNNKKAQQQQQPAIERQARAPLLVSPPPPSRAAALSTPTFNPGQRKKAASEDDDPAMGLTLKINQPATTGRALIQPPGDQKPKTPLMVQEEVKPPKAASKWDDFVDNEVSEDEEDEDADAFVFPTPSAGNLQIRPPVATIPAVAPVTTAPPPASSTTNKLQQFSFKKDERPALPTPLPVKPAATWTPVPVAPPVIAIAPVVVAPVHAQAISKKKEDNEDPELLLEFEEDYVYE